MKNNHQALALIAITGIVIVSILSITMNVNSGKIDIQIKMPGIEIGTKKSN